MSLGLTLMPMFLISEEDSPRRRLPSHAGPPRTATPICQPEKSLMHISHISNFCLSSCTQRERSVHELLWLKVEISSPLNCRWCHVSPQSCLGTVLSERSPTDLNLIVLCGNLTGGCARAVELWARLRPHCHRTHLALQHLSKAKQRSGVPQPSGTQLKPTPKHLAAQPGNEEKGGGS